MKQINFDSPHRQYAVLPMRDDDPDLAKFRDASTFFVANALALTIDWPSVEAMNADVNASVKYVPDPKDYWQPPKVTWASLSGDCEDYALLKLGILLRAGLPLSGAALVLGEIASLAGNAHHAFLVVEIDGTQRVLDNKFDQLIDPTEYLNWVPRKAIIADGTGYLYSAVTTIASSLTV
jgi:predicted transglutaminase-like cysteine proteinase